ncbi:hypothetical protein MMC28_007954, partial [Mycoblastus sanguinarius]|nr:hypothetical protein [Mycoblastus sanguinarius]
MVCFSPSDEPYCGAYVADYGVSANPEGAPYLGLKNIVLGCCPTLSAWRRQNGSTQWPSFEQYLLNLYPDVERITIRIIRRQSPFLISDVLLLRGKPDAQYIKAYQDSIRLLTQNVRADESTLQETRNVRMRNLAALPIAFLAIFQDGVFDVQALC